jgi:hypothetical protein
MLEDEFFVLALFIIIHGSDLYLKLHKTTRISSPTSFRKLTIGDTTSGAGNIADPYLLEDDYIITIPVGRIVDPITKSGGKVLVYHRMLMQVRRMPWK